MKDKQNYFITKFIFVFAICILDQASKFYIIDYFKAAGKQFEKINNYFDLVLVWNKGISFGMFNNSDKSNMIFLVLSLLITCFLSYILIKPNKLIDSISYVLITGGSLGNIFDRIERGAVADFIQLHYLEHYWPAFNIADSSICAGVFLMIIGLIWSGKSNEQK